MFYGISEDGLNAGSLPARLRALPAVAPPPGGWDRLNRRLAARRARWAAAGTGLALAASVLVAIGLVSLRPAVVPPALETLGAPAVAQPEVAQLIRRSQALERELSTARPQVAMWTAGRDSRAAALERRLRLIDAQLNFADSDSAERLWRERVKLMNALVQLHQPEGPALQYASYQY